MKNDSESIYKELVENTPLCVKVFDKDRGLIFVSKGGREEHFLVGKSEEEIRNWKYMECIKPEYHELVKNSLAKACEGHESEFDMEHVPGTSTGQWCHSNLIPVKDNRGEVKHVLFISRDVTKEKQVEGQKNKDVGELEKFNKLMVGREMKMIELKKEIEKLKDQIKSNE